MNELLTRDQFRTSVFARDGYGCVMCFKKAQDAHHIMERRLWPDGGYYLDNGASLCGPCHLLAEATVIDPWDIAARLGFTVMLPPHLYPDQRYDKWGNPVLPNGRRLKGELFDDESVQKILGPLLHLFDNRIKYPRTWHLPWSVGVGEDDRVLSYSTIAEWKHEVVITEKMDGENTSMYRDYIHARSVDWVGHESRNWIKRFHASIAGDIPEGWRICGENLWAKHSLKYINLRSYFQVFSIWDGLNCLSWPETVEWCELIGLQTVPVLWQGTWKGLGDTNLSLDFTKQEGYVIRPTDAFRLRDFTTKVGKFVRRGHVQTHGHWFRSNIERNELA